MCARGLRPMALTVSSAWKKCQLPLCLAIQHRCIVYFSVQFISWSQESYPCEDRELSVPNVLPAAMVSIEGNTWNRESKSCLWDSG